MINETTSGNMFQNFGAAAKCTLIFVLGFSLIGLAVFGYSMVQQDSGDDSPVYSGETVRVPNPQNPEQNAVVTMHLYEADEGTCNLNGMISMGNLQQPFDIGVGDCDPEEIDDDNFFYILEQRLPEQLKFVARIFRNGETAANGQTVFFRQLLGLP